ncbi:hypothetical protein QE399_001271 [Paracidovorax wautersii]|uniref:Uncharacterized protein n=1 Tax=Paracidovorax wautersii TaxID=1177982 RepID=A0ABU1I8P1_9BURK|nr:hypothetical protein [Paracidovorax wautersii]
MARCDIREVRASELQFYASAGFDGDDKRAFIARPPR